jgi:iron(III) transport system substrate-binding protein
MHSLLLALLLLPVVAASARAQDFGPRELIAAAKAEGKLVYYTANFAEGSRRS